MPHPVLRPVSLASALALGLLACAPAAKDGSADPDSPPETSAPPTGTTAPDPTTPPTTDTVVEPTDTGTVVTLPVFDCATVPAVAGAQVNLEAPRGYNDVVFDVNGAMIGSADDSFWKATDAVTATIHAVGTGTVYKMGLLPDGGVVAARSGNGGGGILRVEPSGGTSVLLPGILAYGVAVGGDGKVYAATNYTADGAMIVRVDPATGDYEQILDATDYPPRAIGFSRDFTRLYFGTIDDGFVYGIEFDANHDPVGDPYLVAALPESWHDTLEVDACGQIYVGSFFSTSIMRIGLDGTIVNLLDWPTNDYGHGFEWGSAAGGWNEQAIYVTHPYINERVSEIDIGVPGAQWVGEVIGGGVL